LMVENMRYRFLGEEFSIAIRDVARRLTIAAGHPSGPKMYQPQYTTTYRELISSSLQGEKEC
jgi:hypothetical protein